MALLVHPVAVVHLSRAVDTHANQKSVVAKKLAPFVIQQYSVCLDRIGDALASRTILLLQLDDPAEKSDPQQRWFAALPGEINLRHILGLDILADVAFEHCV